MDDAIRVLIVDDHPIVRQGLRTFLESREGIEVAGEAADGHEAVQLVLAVQPDVVLLDLVMPGMDGLAALEGIRARRPETRVVVITSFGSSDQVLAAVRAGAAGYLLKDAEPQDIDNAIRAAHRGEPVLHPAAAAVLMRQVDAPAPPHRAEQVLTPRELEVLRLLARGMSNRELAAHLVVSEKTVKTHVSSVLAKLRLADRTQAALYAVREGLVDPADISRTS
jgi:two-component system, NarL family, response regulator LiaR